MRRFLFESLIWALSRRGRNISRATSTASIFLLRNNDIGDLLVITPLFDALKHQYRQVKIVAGIGRWNFPVLENNPHVSEILPVHAPWHNKNCCRVPHNSLRGLLRSMRYILRSPEVKDLQRRKFDIGIDVLGSPEGSLLMMRAGIPHRLGVRGYAGGHSATQQYVDYNPQEHVGRSALRFAELLGAHDLPEVRPQLFLSPQEEEAAERIWRGLDTVRENPIRVVIGPGGGFLAKCWPIESYEEFTRKLASRGGCRVIVVGGAQDARSGDRLAAISPIVNNFAGEFSLRETFAMVAKADLVVCNSSMLMHVAAAFSKPALVLLGDSFSSATQHGRQWGYGKLTLVLGKDAGRDRIFTPEEAADAFFSQPGFKAAEERRRVNCAAR